MHYGEGFLPVLSFSKLSRVLLEAMFPISVTSHYNSQRTFIFFNLYSYRNVSFRQSKAMQTWLLPYVTFHIRLAYKHFRQVWENLKLLIEAFVVHNSYSGRRNSLTGLHQAV